MGNMIDIGQQGKRADAVFVIKRVVANLPEVLDVLPFSRIKVAEVEWNEYINEVGGNTANQSANWASAFQTLAENPDIKSRLMKKDNSDVYFNWNRKDSDVEIEYFI